MHGSALFFSDAPQGGSPVLSLLPLPSVEGDEPGREDITDAGGVDSEEVEDLVDALEQRALLLEHLMTVKECLGDEMADQLSPYLSSRYLFRRVFVCFDLHLP